MTLNEFLKHHAIDIEPDLESREWQRNGAFYLRIWSTTLNEEAIVEAVAGDWSESRQVFWRSTDDPEKLKELGEARAGVDQELKAQRLANQKAVSQQALATFTRLGCGGLTPYMKRKGIDKLYGARIELAEDGDVLFVPAFDIEGHLWGYQRILPRKKEGENDKWFLKGMRTYGTHCVLGDPTRDRTFYIAEGYATACSIHMATGTTTICAFNAGNLEPVALAFRQKYPTAQIIICGDDDRWNPANPGKTKAIDAARKAKAEARFPAFKSLDDKPTDFNDLHAREGLDIVKSQLFIQAKKRNPNALEFETLAKKYAKPVEKIQWLAENLLAKGGTSMLAGKPKSGKTTLSRGLALAVAEGKDFLGRKTVQGKVLYLAVEEKESELIAHFRKMGATPEAAENILIHASVAPQNTLQLLVPLIELHRPELIILDTLFKIVRVKDENAYAAVGDALEPINTLARDTGCHIMCLHHLGKVGRDGADGILGSTAIAGLFDTNMILNRSDDRRTLKTQARYGRELEETILEFDAGRGAVSLGKAKRDNDAEEVADEIIGILKGRREPAGETEIAEIIGGNRSRRLRALRQLCESGRVIKSGSGSKKDPFRYALSGCGALKIDEAAVENGF